MRLPLSLLILLLYLPVLVHGQDSGFLSGYIVNKSNDTIQGFVKYINQVPYRILPDIQFKQSENAKAIKYKPNDLIGYMAGASVFLSMKVPNDPYGREAFMELVIDGHLKLFKSTVTALGSPQYGAGTSSTYYLLKGESQFLFDIDNGKFKDTASEYLSDVKEVSEKVKIGDFTKSDIETIVKEYNRLYGY